MEVSRPEKILLAMHAIAQGTTRALKYEDIVVKAFEMYPRDFGLRGYPQFPDSSDVHKPLYGPLKRMGLVRAANKTFGLTEKGLTRAIELSGDEPAHGTRTERLTRDMETEVERLLKSQAVVLAASGKLDRVLDTDFYSYLAVTVRTKTNDFMGRLQTVKDAVDVAAKLEPTTPHLALAKIHAELVSKFERLIPRKVEIKQ